MSRPVVLVVTATAALWGGGCGEPEPCRVGSTSSSEIDFEHCRPETDAVGEVCGRRIVSGEARVGETWHPGEQGIVIEAGGEVVLVSPFTLSDSSRTVSFLALCEDGARLFFNDAEVHVRDGAVARRYGSFDVVWPESFDEPANTARVEGRGSCWIDDLRVVSTIRSCPDSFDAGPDDWRFDAGRDAGRFDAGRDAGRLDAGVDGGPLDAGSPDASGLDGAAPEGGASDADVGPSDGGTDAAAADAAG